MRTHPTIVAENKALCGGKRDVRENLPRTQPIKPATKPGPQQPAAPMVERVVEAAVAGKSIGVYAPRLEKWAADAMAAAINAMPLAVREKLIAAWSGPVSIVVDHTPGTQPIEVARTAYASVYRVDHRLRQASEATRLAAFAAALAKTAGVDAEEAIAEQRELVEHDRAMEVLATYKRGDESDLVEVPPALANYRRAK